MQIMTFNYAYNQLDMYHESAAIRAACLLHQAVVVGGTTFREIRMEAIFNAVDLNDMISFLQGRYENAGMHQQAALIAKTARALKEGRRIKHPSKELIVSRKKLENSIIETFRNDVKLCLGSVTKLGLIQLSEFAAEGNTPIWFCAVDEEGPEHADDIFVAASDILLLQPFYKQRGMKDGHDPYVFMLQEEFFDPGFLAGKTIYSSTDAEAANPDAIFLDPCFRLPALNAMSPAEMTLIMRQSRVMSELFGNQLEGWYEECLANDTRALNYFTVHVKPAMEKLQQQLDDSDMIRYHYQLDRTQQHVVMAGHMPLSMIWEFYRHFGAIPDTTWAVLQEAKKAEPATWNKRYPVLVCRTIYADGGQQRTISTEERLFKDALLALARKPVTRN